MSLLITVAIVCCFVFILCLFIVISGKLLGQSGSVELTINENKKSVVNRGQTLFAALSQNDIHLPAACGGKGNCGRCKVHVLYGGGPVTSLEEVTLGSQAIKDNQRLACQVKLRENASVSVSEELLLAKSFKATLIETKMVAYRIKTLRFKLENEDCIDFKAGQYVQITRETPYESIIRAYSISSSPTAKNEFALDVQCVENGLVSPWLHSLSVGTILDFTGPFGEMGIEKDVINSDIDRIVLIAGGVGLAPMRSMITYLIESDYSGNIVLFHGARSRKHLYCEDEYKLLHKKHSNFSYIPVLSEPALEDGWTGATGMVTEAVSKWADTQNWLSANRIAPVTNGLQHDSPVNMTPGIRVYLCGPSVMMEASRKILSEKGIDNENIYSDPFSF